MAALNQRPPEIPLSRFSPSYLHSNSTSHAWPFGAIAELIDNAYDPDVNASSIYIDYEEISGYPCLTFTDDGNGLDIKKMHLMLSFGFSDKAEINGKRPIGVFGNGFKSGSMRLGKDAIVFSKVKDSMVIGFLSQTYLKEINAEDIRVPIVQFNQKLKEHEMSSSHIKSYSIFKSDLAIKEQFKKISARGTRIVIYNLRQEKALDGQIQVTNNDFDFKADPNDILIAGGRSKDRNDGMTKQLRAQQLEETPRCDFSLRAYCSVLYLNPKIKIFLRKKKVRTLRIAKSLKETEKDVYRPMGGNSKVTITFGFNPKKNQPYGVCFYHNNRMIKSYQRLGYQTKADHRGSQVVGVIDCNFLEPTHNKQDFNNNAAYSRCVKAVEAKLNDYWNEKRETDQVSGTSNQFLGNKEKDTPDYTWVQCEKCSKWRKLPDSVDPDKLPDQWFCSMNKNLSQNNCDVREEPEDHDEELTRPTYDKNYKKSVKKLQQKLAETLLREESKKREKQKMQLEKMEAPEVQLNQSEEKNVKKLQQKLTETLRREELNQSEEKKSSGVDNDGYIWIDSEEDGDEPPKKRVKTEPGQVPISKDLQQKPEIKVETGPSPVPISEDLQQKPPKIMVKTEPGRVPASEGVQPDCLQQKPSEIKVEIEPDFLGSAQSALSRDQQSMVCTSTKAVQTDFANQHSERDSHLKLRKAEEKLKNLRGLVTQFLKKVVPDDLMQEIINDPHGDKVDEVLQDVMNLDD